MSGLKQELGLAQGVGLLSTSLLGTGVFAVPALAALVAGGDSLWAWPVLIILVFPVAIVFAILGRHFPSAGGVAHFVDMAFGPRLARVTGWLFLSVIPVGLPAALHIATGFGQALFGWHDSQLLLAEIGTLAIVWWLGSRGAKLQRQPANAGCSTHCGTHCRHLVVWRYSPERNPLPTRNANCTQPFVFGALGDVLVLRRPGGIRPSGL